MARQNEGARKREDYEEYADRRNPYLADYAAQRSRMRSPQRRAQVSSGRRRTERDTEEDNVIMMPWDHDATDKMKQGKQAYLEDDCEERGYAQRQRPAPQREDDCEERGYAQRHRPMSYGERDHGEWGYAQRQRPMSYLEDGWEEGYAQRQQRPAPRRERDGGEREYAQRQRPAAHQERDGGEREYAQRQRPVSAGERTYDEYDTDDRNAQARGRRQVSRKESTEENVFYTGKRSAAEQRENAFYIGKRAGENGGNTPYEKDDRSVRSARKAVSAVSMPVSRPRTLSGPVVGRRSGAAVRPRVPRGDFSGYGFRPGTRRPTRARRRKRAQRQQFMVGVWILCIVILAGFYIFKNNQAAEAGNMGEGSVQSSGGNNTGAGAYSGAMVQGLPSEVFEGHPRWEENFLTPNEYSRPGDALETVTNLFVHYTANPGTSAAQNRSYFEQQKDTHEVSVSSHFIIGYDGEIIQCVPLDEIAYAVMTRNYDSISIECCYLAEDGSFTQETYDSLVSLLAWLTEAYGLDSEDILRHYDCGGKKCPIYYTEHEDAWEQLKKDVDKL